MALTSSDLLLLQRSGLKTCQIGDLASKMQNSDLVMLDQGSGLRKATWGQRSDFNSSDLFTVGRSTSIYKTTWGAILGFLTIEAEIISANNNTATNQQVTLDDLFTTEQLQSPAPKRITIKPGAVVGSTDPNIAALHIRTSAETSGTITVVNEGSIYGAGGAAGVANTGAAGFGGPAFETSLDVILINKSEIFGGGGGGGGGGKGGNGSVTSNVFAGKGNCVTSSVCLNGGDKGQQSSCVNRYGAGSTCGSKCFGCQSPAGTARCDGCYVSQTSTSYGGDGGAGGAGMGYLQAMSAGQSGASGGTNAGNGGNGGSGGDWGTAGVSGQAGLNGNSTNGSQGGSAGAGGQSTTSNGKTITLTNTGTLKGVQN